MLKAAELALGIISYLPGTPSQPEAKPKQIEVIQSEDARSFWFALLRAFRWPDCLFPYGFNSSMGSLQGNHVKTSLSTAVSSLLLCACSSLVYAQTVPAGCTAGTLDTSYGPAASGGYVQISPVFMNESEFETGVFDSANNFYIVSSAAVDMLGQSLPTIVKLKPGGTRDLTYGGFGSVVPAPPTAGVYDVSLAIDGSDRTVIGMISADQTNIVLARYSSAGVLDASFGTNGELTIPFPNYVNAPWAVKAAADGTLFIAAATYTSNGPPWQPVVVKVTPAGAIDTSFGTAGFASFYANNFGPFGKATDMNLNADGTILVAGRVGDNSTYDAFFVARLTSYGTLDTSFGTSQGLTVVSFGNIIAYGRKMAVQSNGKIVVLGGIIPANDSSQPVSDTGVIRLLANGALDKTFNGTGSLHLTNALYQILGLQDNNKILMGGIASPTPTTATGLVQRLLTNGQPDPAFGASGNGIVSLVDPGPPYTGIVRLSVGPGGGIFVHSGSGLNGTSAGAGYVTKLDAGSGAGCH
jgi:uncharacterized delta-60 repeat protein